MSSVRKVASWLKATVVGMPPGAARKNFWAASPAPPLMSHWLIASPSVPLCTLPHDRSSRSARPSSPRMPRMPPARCTSSMWYLSVAGAALHRQGTRREMRSMSDMVKSTPASWAAASRCSTVLVEPPIATSSVMAFSNALLVAMLRGSTEASSCS
ncbi:Uncharacterised protein [Bordetella pertussis]|nr:Uncharacterised protein [Bordetella pertussis]CFP10291.1 Uncharacterised protein [Bordetella pertussis]CPO85159.1 Uncharacterised protein [Bordetella pertussis]CPP45461.1 Uncharacterised protein [Bordetella pertussis]CPQ23528.1 Uncharacterised protein [Bordetella pertussis]